MLLDGIIFFLIYLGLCFMMAPYILYKCSKVERIGWSDAGLLVLIWPLSVPYMAFHGMGKFRAEYKQQLEQAEQEREMEQFERQMEREKQVDRHLDTDVNDILKQEFEDLQRQYDDLDMHEEDEDPVEKEIEHLAQFHKSAPTILTPTTTNPLVDGTTTRTRVGRSFASDEVEELYKQQQDHAEIISGPMTVEYEDE